MVDVERGGLSAEQLQQHGLMLKDGGRLIFGTLRFERPGYLYGHRLKDCTAGAFTYFNAAGNISCYRVHFGRYSQVGESAIVGPPEHPQDWFSSHPFAFTRPRYMPNIYKLPDFQRLGPDDEPGPSYVDGVPSETWVGHEAYIGVNSFVKRGVRVGDGAIIGANSVITKDVPPYAVVAGSPARVIKLRFPEKIVERFLALQWWRYDLAPYKNAVDFSRAEATLDFFEQRKADGQLQTLRPDTFSIQRKADGFQLVKLPQTLYFPD